MEEHSEIQALKTRSVGYQSLYYPNAHPPLLPTDSKQKSKDDSHSGFDCILFRRVKTNTLYNETYTNLFIAKQRVLLKPETDIQFNLHKD